MTPSELFPGGAGLYRTDEGILSRSPGNSKRFDAMHNYPITVIFTQSVVEQLKKESEEYSPSIEIFAKLNTRRDISLLKITEQFFQHVAESLKADPNTLEFKVRKDPTNIASYQVHRGDGMDRSTHLANEVINSFKVEFLLTKRQSGTRSSTEIRKFDFDNHLKSKHLENLVLKIDYNANNWFFTAEQPSVI